MDLGRGSAGCISGSLSDRQIDNAHAKALEILGPGTVTRDQIEAIVLAAHPVSV